MLQKEKCTAGLDRVSSRSISLLDHQSSERFELLAVPDFGPIVSGRRRKKISGQTFEAAEDSDENLDAAQQTHSGKKSETAAWKII